MKVRSIGWVLFAVATLAFLGGIIGGFLGIGVLDRMLFGNAMNREVVLQESSVIIDVANQLEPSVVSITAEGAPQTDIFGREFEGRSGAGTGIIISADGLILTNRHVVPEDSDISVTLADGSLYDDVAVVARDPLNDIAYLKLATESELTPAELGDSDQVVVGQRVIAIGNVLGRFSNSVTSGIISAIGRPITANTGNGSLDTEQLHGLLQTDAAINPGNSGGPLVNIEGQVIGVNTAVAGGAENIGFAIPINQVKAGIESIMTQGRLVKPYLGIRYVTLNRQIAAAEGLDIDEGAYITAATDQNAVLPDSPAATAGLRAGDIIVAVNGAPVDYARPLAVHMSRFQAGDELELNVFRKQQQIEVAVKLAEIPASF
ncbi:MAG: trypsin-like peptidase domain-containing protein [Candidatus Saccharimonadales bacterium]